MSDQPHNDLTEALNSAEPLVGTAARRVAADRYRPS